MNSSTKQMILDAVKWHNGNAEKAGKWLAKMIRCSIREVRPLVAQAMQEVN